MTNYLFLKDVEVAQRYNISRSTIWRLVSKGNFPKPIKISSGSTRWRMIDLEKWEETKRVEKQK